MTTNNANSTEAVIKKQLADNPVILYMKGTPEAPECGFSGAAVAALKQTGKPFAYVNILQAPFIRERLPKVSNWPTFPQLFINGELVGGSDIVVAMVADGSLIPMLEQAHAGTN
ncbi:Grx4 family monothiol glutaredoxin [Ketobacter sp.]|uniref:Grx4 family monothiol glutaredoxin n=1 Tax=Ketobacter sp. TaxID=2083498 RepID=UPI000F268C41|nr:Grx4 family monothiol glutaredoxin [Ketobacter sp.]RLU02036.1 MAG: Grx4 family monothiol glutaredoxin [Ketobacter sp.]